MPSLVVIIEFIICAASAAGAMLIAHSFVTTYNTSFHRHHFYYLVAFYLFAIYGIWGQILGRMLLVSLDVGSGAVEAVANFLSIMGVPVLFVSWLMLINMAWSMYGAEVRQTLLPIHAGVFVLLILGSWLALAVSPANSDAGDLNLQYLIVAAMIGVELMYFLAFLLIGRRLGQSVHEEARSRLWKFSLLLAGAFVLRSALLPAVWLHPAGVLVVLVYFGSNLVPLLYLRSENDGIFEPVRAELTTTDRLDQIVDQYGITKRERQIVEEICSGKTNKQIADDLFISLQTVKDHTHRIYSKIGIRSRLQLVQKVNE